MNSGSYSLAASKAEFAESARSMSQGALKQVLERSKARQFCIAIGVVVAVSVANTFLEPIVGVHATAFIFLLSVALLALFVDRGPTLTAAAVSALVWDYFFLPPVFAFRVTHVEDAMLLATYVIVALTLGELTARIRKQQVARRQGEDRAHVLAESERLSKTLLDSMSHEIRTPIAAIKGALGNYLQDEGHALTPAQRVLIAEVQEANDRLDRLVGKALDFARLESGRIIPTITLCDVADLIHVCIKETRRELERHPLTVEVAPDLPLARMDFVLMQQAVTNLLSNAAAHTPPGTSVAIRAWADSTHLRISVRDTGVGLTNETLQRAFDKFYRGPGAPTGGTGLGLSLVRGFVEAQGGTVRADNHSAGGAAFTIEMPLTRAVEAAT